VEAKFNLKIQVVEKVDFFHRAIYKYNSESIKHDSKTRIKRKKYE
jgi:hypothetical protein